MGIEKYSGKWGKRKRYETEGRVLLVEHAVGRNGGTDVMIKGHWKNRQTI